MLNCKKKFPIEIQTTQIRDESYLIDSIDSPSCVSFSSEITNDLHTTDSALVFADNIEGACAQTKTVLHQAIRECESVLVVNEADILKLGS